LNTSNVYWLVGLALFIAAILAFVVLPRAGVLAAVYGIIVGIILIIISGIFSQQPASQKKYRDKKKEYVCAYE
jgi:hypothetical protein